MNVLLLLSAALAAASPSQMHAQQTNPLGSVAPTTQVRIRNPGARKEWIIGRVEAAGLDSIVVTASSGKAWRLKTSNVAWADTLGGERRRTGDGFVLGFVAGFGVGGGIAFVRYEECDGGFLVCGFNPGRATEVIVAGVAVGLLGGILGAAVGHEKKADRWRPLDLPKTMRPLIRPSRGGLKVGASVRFSPAFLAQ